jgi:sarcosine oxidase
MSKEHATHHDTIVIGTGSMGSSVLFHLALRGIQVLGLEQFGVVHEQGSHGGQSRIIRKAYFEHPDYIPLLMKAYENWAMLESLSGRKIYTRTGLFYTGPKGDPLLNNVKESASRYGIELSELSAVESNRKFPQFNIPENFEVIFEPDAGFLRPDLAIKTYVEEALKLGARISTNEKVIAWKKVGNIVEVITSHQTYTCRKLVITAGPWASTLIPGIRNYLTVTRQVMAWYKPEDGRDLVTGACPCWFIVKPGLPGSFYGFPIMTEGLHGDPVGFKIAYHYPGQPVDPDNVDRHVADHEMNELRTLLQEYIPGANGQLVHAKTCLYSNSPDGDFVIDNLPGTDEQVCVAWGFSGHGFKFVSVVGEILADLVIHGRTNLPTGFLSANRFS